jgi:hypothetical protein
MVSLYFISIFPASRPNRIARAQDADHGLLFAVNIRSSLYDLKGDWLTGDGHQFQEKAGCLRQPRDSRADEVVERKGRPAGGLDGGADQLADEERAAAGLPSDDFGSGGAPCASGSNRRARSRASSQVSSFSASWVRWTAEAHAEWEERRVRSSGLVSASSVR